MPRKPPSPTFAPGELDRLFVEVVAAFGAAPVDARRIDDEDEPGAITYGVCEGGRITIDEAPHLVETMLHELVHRMRPRWGERRTLAAERALFARLSREQVEALYSIYLAVRRSRKSPLVL